MYACTQTRPPVWVCRALFLPSPSLAMASLKGLGHRFMVTAASVPLSSKVALIAGNSTKTGSSYFALIKAAFSLVCWPGITLGPDVDPCQLPAQIEASSPQSQTHTHPHSLLGPALGFQSQAPGGRRDAFCRIHVHPGLVMKTCACVETTSPTQFFSLFFYPLRALCEIPNCPGAALARAR